MGIHRLREGRPIGPWKSGSGRPESRLVKAFKKDELVRPNI